MPYKNDCAILSNEPKCETTEPWEWQPITIPLLEYVTLKTRIERLIMEKEAATSKWYEAMNELSTMREQMGGE